MLIPGGFLSGTLFPWVLCAPLLPLLCLVLRKPVMGRTLIAMILLCTVTVLADIFLYMSRSQASLVSAFQGVAIFFEFIFSCLLLWTLTADNYIRYGIATASLVFAAIFLTLTVVTGFEAFQPYLVKFGFALLFLFSILVLFTLQQNLSRHLNETPEFWIAAGLLFECGLLAFLLLVNQDLQPGAITPNSGLEVMLALITFIKYIFFCLGIWQYKRLENKK
jgi:hypothetical protein